MNDANLTQNLAYSIAIGLIGVGSIATLVGLFYKKRDSRSSTNKNSLVAHKAPLPSLSELEKTTVYPILTGAEIIELTNTQALIKAIENNSGFNKETFDSCVFPILEKLAQYCQLLPASESHHHAYLGGLFEHLLEVCLFALKQRSGKMLPTGVGVEVISAQRHIWTYAVLIGAVLHDIDKLKDLFVITLLNDPHEISGKPYDPSTGSFCDFSSNYNLYRVKFNSERTYNASEQALSKVLFQSMIPQRGRQWLSDYPNCLKTLKYYLFAQSHPEHKTDKEQLAQMIVLADQNSVRTHLARDGYKKPRLKSATQTPLAHRLLLALYEMLLSGELSWNRAGAVAFYDQPHLAFVSKTLADSLRKWLETHHQDPSIPQDNTRIFDTLAEMGYCISIDAGAGGYHAVHSIYIVIKESEQQSWRNALTCIIFNWDSLCIHFMKTLGIKSDELDQLMTKLKQLKPVTLEGFQGKEAAQTSVQAITQSNPNLSDSEEPTQSSESSHDSGQQHYHLDQKTLIEDRSLGEPPVFSAPVKNTEEPQKATGSTQEPTTQIASMSSAQTPHIATTLVDSEKHKAFSELFKPLRLNDKSKDKSNQPKNKIKSAPIQQQKNEITDEDEINSARLEEASHFIMQEDSIKVQSAAGEIDASERNTHPQNTNLTDSAIKPITAPIQHDFNVLDKLLDKSKRPDLAKVFLQYLQGVIQEGHFNNATHFIHFIDYLGETCLFVVSPLAFQRYSKENQHQLTNNGITINVLQDAVTSLNSNIKHPKDGNFIRVEVNPELIRKKEDSISHVRLLRGLLFNATITSQLVNPVPAPNPYLQLGYESIEKPPETVKPALSLVKKEAATTKKQPKKPVSDDEFDLDEINIPESAFYSESETDPQESYV